MNLYLEASRYDDRRKSIARASYAEAQHPALPIRIVAPGRWPNRAERRRITSDVRRNGHLSENAVLRAAERLRPGQDRRKQARKKARQVARLHRRRNGGK